MNILLTLLVGVAGWKAAAKLKLPAPAMLGSMLAVGITNILFSYASLPTAVKIFAQAISGAFIGMQISRKDVANFRFLIRPFVFLAVLLTVNTVIVGMVIHQLCGLDLTTALLSCVAGGVTDISLIAMEMQADAGTVALMQTSRLVCVLLFFPAWIKWMTRKEGESREDLRLQPQAACRPTFLDRLIKKPQVKIVFTIAVSTLFGYLGHLSKIPAASMVFPMIVIVLLNCTTAICRVPVQIKNIAQLLAGSLVGASITRATFADLGTTLIPIGLLLVSYWLVNLIYSLTCRRCGWLDLKSAMFASAPGGATDMSLIAADLNANLTKIALIQVLRAAYVVIVMPPLILLWVRLFS